MKHTLQVRSPQIKNQREKKILNQTEVEQDKTAILISELKQTLNPKSQKQ